MTQLPYLQRLTAVHECIAGNQWADVQTHEPLHRHTTWKVGGPADLWIEPLGTEAVGSILETLELHAIPWVVLGKGSNTLASDEGYRGAVLNLERGLAAIRLGELQDGRAILEVGGGAPVAGVLRFTVENQLAGIEMLTGVPGTIGGAIRMNAGTHLGEAKDTLQEVYLLRDGGSPQWVDASHLNLAYRSSNVGPRDVVLGARFEVRTEGGEEVGKTVREVRERRRRTQPLTEPSGGSTFANPPSHRAWALLDEAGLRGRKVGGAWFSELHPNFLVQAGEATANDMKTLIDLAKAEVHRHAGVQLREEISRLEPQGWVPEERAGW